MNVSATQKRIYNLVAGIASGTFDDEEDFIKQMVQEIVNNKDFQILGGRIWRFLPEEKSYDLVFQYGNLKRIPEFYKLTVDEQPVLQELFHNRTLLRKETDQLLMESGILIYSVTGVGEIIRTPYGKYYEYVLGFNAPEILQTFYETLSIISTVGSARIRDIRIQKKAEKFNKELNKASEIQRNLFPEHEASFSDFEIYGLCIPDSEVGGDYFDYFQSSEQEENRFSIVVADAASKGFSAAIQALFVSGAVKMAHSFSPKISLLFHSLNNLIYSTFPLERFVTLFYCELTESSNRLVLYGNAGHTEPIHYRNEDDTFRYLSSTGGILGIVPNQKFSVENIRMKSGDILVIMTDGISEAQNENNEMLGTDIILESIRRNKDYSAKEIALSIIEKVQQFSAKTNYNDDKTLIVVKRKIS